MKGFITNIEKDSLENTFFRKVLYTSAHMQLVVMTLQPNEDIGEEVHHLDQFIRCESGEGQAVLDGIAYDIRDGFAVIIPAGVKHNLLNTSSEVELKLYTVYAPPNHEDGTIHETKAEAELDEEHYVAEIKE